MSAHTFIVFLQHASYPIGLVGLLLAVAGLRYDRQTSPRIRLVFGLLVAALIAGVWSTGVVCAQDVVCACDACSKAEPYSALWWLLGCWL